MEAMLEVDKDAESTSPLTAWSSPHTGPDTVLDNQTTLASEEQLHKLTPDLHHRSDAGSYHGINSMKAFDMNIYDQEAVLTPPHTLLSSMGGGKLALDSEHREELMEQEPLPKRRRINAAAVENNPSYIPSPLDGHLYAEERSAGETKLPCSSQAVGNCFEVDQYVDESGQRHQCEEEQAREKSGSEWAEEHSDSDQKWTSGRADGSIEHKDSFNVPLEKKQRKNSAEPFAKSCQEEELASMLVPLEEHLGLANEAGEKKRDKKKKAVKKKLHAEKESRTGMVHDLMGSNVLDSANRAAHTHPSQVASTETDRKKALEEMISGANFKKKKDARAGFQELGQALSRLGRAKALEHEPETERWILPGMKTSLYSHQIIGIDFMRRREKGESAPFGGIIADQMGLGKTLQTIGIMIANGPSAREKRKCTLIVVPPGLLAQWAQEIKAHTERRCFGTIIEHRPGNRITGTGVAAMMEQANVVLTTYNEVAKSYPQSTLPKDLETPEEQMEWWKDRWDKVRGPLHRAHFYRVILDEAQGIQNWSTQRSRSCRALMAKFRWALSGTPIMNRVAELYPYFKFLRVPGVGDRDAFEKKFCQSNERCNGPLHPLLDKIMLRRSHEDTIGGAAIVKLPENAVSTVSLQFSPVEGALYFLTTKYLVGKVKEWTSDGTLRKHPQITIQCLMRLRQMCSHILQAQDIFSDFLTISHLNKIEERLVGPHRAENKHDRDLLSALRRFILAKQEEAELQATRESTLSSTNQSNAGYQHGKLAKEFALFLQELTDSGNLAELNNRVFCGGCNNPPEDPRVTDCFHVYCNECLQGMSQDAALQNLDHTSCTKCCKPFEKSESCEGLEELDVPQSRKSFGNKQIKLQRKKTHVDTQWCIYDNKIILSTKLREAQRQIEQWLSAEPNEKIIVFSQWRLGMRIFQAMCDRKGWGVEVLHGQVAQDKRSGLVKRFREKPDRHILIASLKCGGTGLNLTMANKIIHLDLWFNQATEDQAFCRVVRIGQERKTYIRRYIIANSIDIKLEEMQMRKQVEIDGAIDDQDIPKGEKAEDLLHLLSSIKVDEEKYDWLC